MPNYLIPSYVSSVATSWFSLSPSHWQYPTRGAPASGWMKGEGDGEEEGRQFAPVMGLLCPHMLFSLSLVTRGGMCCAWRQMVWSRFLLEPEGRRREVAGKWMKKVGGQWERNRKKWRDYSQNPELTVRNPLIENHTAATVNLYFGQDEETKKCTILLLLLRPVWIHSHCTFSCGVWLVFGDKVQGKSQSRADLA